MTPLETGPSSGIDIAYSPTQLDGIHGELIASLPPSNPKAAVIRLMEHLGRLPSVAAHPQTLYFHVATLSELCARVLTPIPLSNHVELLCGLVRILDSAMQTPAARQVTALPKAASRLRLLLAAEYALRGAQGAAPVTPGSTVEPADAADEHATRLQRLMASSEGREVEWPLHFREPETCLPRHAILTVLTDGAAIPGHCREGYLAALEVTVTLRGRHEKGCVVRGRDARGEDVILGDEFRDLVHEAVDRAVGLLGPFAQDRVRRLQALVDVTLQSPGLVTEVHGRSLLLPLVLVLVHAVAEQLNLAATVSWDAGMVWTGDVDAHGNLQSVAGLPEKLARVYHSRAGGFAYPAADDLALRSTRHGLSGRNRDLLLLPVINLVDLTAPGGAATIKPRSLLTRGAFLLRKVSRPLGIAGTIVVSVFLLAAAYAVPRLSSWLDRTPTAAFVTADSAHIELRNSRERTLRVFPISHTSTPWAVIADLEGDDRHNILVGTSCSDPEPGSVWCYDQRGRERWRFTGGFRPDEPAPYALENRFAVAGISCHDLDRDGRDEIIIGLTHNPYFAGQLALLRSDGSYVSSFWHPGHLSLYRGPDFRDVPLFVDLDRDGYDEILIGATNNRLNRAALIVLDPRSVRGKGYQGPGDPPDPQWQSYVVFPRLAEVEEALDTPRFHAGMLSMEMMDGRPLIRVSLIGALPNLGRTNVFNYWLDFDLRVVRFYSGDPFKTWGAWALRKGLLDVDVRSPEFEGFMRQIEVIPGSPELLKP